LAIALFGTAGSVDCLEIIIQELLQSYYDTSFIKHEKCGFERTSIEYLGLFILEEEIQMDLVKVAGIT